MKTKIVDNGLISIIVISMAVICSFVSCKRLPQNSSDQRNPGTRISIDEFRALYPGSQIDDDYHIYSTKPFYIGGKESFNNYVIEFFKQTGNSTLLDSIVENYVMLNIEPNGTVSSPRIVRTNSHCDVCDSLSLVAIGHSKNWIPAYYVEDDTIVYIDSPLVSETIVKIDFDWFGYFHNKSD
jgi:hypothetical protein